MYKFNLAYLQDIIFFNYFYLAEESRKQKEQQRMMKQQEKFERLEQMRIEREIRAQQLLEVILMFRNIFSLFILYIYS